MIDVIVKGIIIGILVSAPMGPIGVLCIQRTLSEGRFQGFISGMGATLSDILYAVIAGLGMGVIMDFIQSNHYPLQVIGSVILLIMGYKIFQSNPAKELLKQEDRKTPYWRNLISSFFINLTNIGILFFFIAMFARFNFINPDDIPLSVIGIVSIGLGTLVWWLVISTIVDKVRERFNPRGLKIFNNILGIVIILIGVVGLALGTYHWTLGA